jgi:hypothetical protein
MPETTCIAREATELQAEILRGRLEADGIEAWLRGAGVASTAGAINDLNTSWANPLGGVEIWVHTSDADEARAILKEVHARSKRAPQQFPNALQCFVGIWVALFAWQTGASIHPLLGYAAGAAVLAGTIVIARK